MSNLSSKNKIIATYGPSLEKFLTLDKNDVNSDLVINKYQSLLDSGLDVVRFNMSHGTIVLHEQIYKNLRQLNSISDKPIGILIDTMGPEIRVQKIQSDSLELNKIVINQTVKIFCHDHELIGNGEYFSVSDFTKKYDLSSNVSVGEIIYIDDGKLLLQIENIDKQNKIIITKSLTDNYFIKSNKRINLLNKTYNLPFISEYDEKVIIKAVQWKADFLALSFVSNLDEINSVKNIIHQTNPSSKIKIIAKIETFEALQNLDAIIKNTDGVMIARGDLAMEIGFDKTPVWQDRILQMCDKYQKIAIVATQMLDSLETKQLPTRAEVIDCYYAVKSLADATMLSGETASGFDPLNAIKTMHKINETSSTSEFLNRPKLKLFFQKVFICLCKFYLRKYKNVVLRNFDERLVRLISSKILTINFFILNNEFIQQTRLTLYKNLNLVSEKWCQRYFFFDCKKFKILEFFGKITK